MLKNSEPAVVGACGRMVSSDRNMSVNGSRRSVAESE